MENYTKQSILSTIGSIETDIPLNYLIVLVEEDEFSRWSQIRSQMTTPAIKSPSETQITVSNI